MSIREITEDEYVRLNRLNTFAQSILANPEAAPLLEKAAKIVDPNIRTPRLDQQTAAQAPFTAITESLAALNKRLDDEAVARTNQDAINQANAKANEGISALRKDGWNDTGIAEIQKIMTERGISDPRDAAIVLERLHPPANVSMPGSNGAFNFNDAITAAKADDDISSLLKTMGKESNGLEAISNKMIADTLKDIRSGQH